MPPLRIPLSRPHEIVVIENLPVLVEEVADEPTWPGRALPRDARRIYPPPWAGGRRPPWAAVLPEPEPVAFGAPARVSFQPGPVPTDLMDEDVEVFEEPPDIDDDIQQLDAVKPVTVDPPEGMVWVPPRQIRLGENTFEVEGYLLDRLLVTRGDWEVFVRATGTPAPEGWRGGRPPPGTEEHPVTDVTWADAVAYASWRGARLPTVAEWLAAAAGLTWFPPNSERCGATLCHCPRAGRLTGTAPVGAHPNSNSMEGASDLLGNVWEWAAPDDRLPPPDIDHAWALGGSFKHACPSQPSTWGTRVPQTMIHRAKSWPHLGFRCARSAS